MADNTLLNPGIGGDLIADEDIAGVKHQLVKLEFGDTGTATKVSAANPLPVTMANAPKEAGGNLDSLPLIKAKTDNLDLATTALRDAIRGTGNKTLTDIDADLAGIQVKANFWDLTISALRDGIRGSNVKTLSDLDARLSTLDTDITTLHTDLTTLLTTADFDTNIGSLTEAAPATDTASSGLNGRLQRMAQRVTSLIALFPASLDGSGFFKVHEQGTAATSVVDGGNVTNGAIADAIVAAGAAGTLSAKLRRVTQGLEDLKTLIVLGAGANVIGKVGIDQSTPGTSNLVQVQGNQAATSHSTWTSGTAQNTANSIPVSNLNTVTVALVTAGTISGGVLTFEVSPDNTNWFQVAMCRIDAFTTETTFTLTGSLTKAWSTSVDGFTNFRVRLSTVITGAGNVDIFVIAQTFAIEPIVTVGQSNAANLQATVTPPTLTKGTQGATGFSVQDLKDSGRVNIALTIEVAGAATTEALATVTESRDGAATATFTSKTITSGKRIRFQSIAIAVESLGSGTAPQRVYLRLRVNTAGATTASSPEQGVWCCINNAAIVKSGAVAYYQIPDGFEIAGDGTKTYGFTLTFPDWVTSTATVQVKVSINAFEF